MEIGMADDDLWCWGRLLRVLWTLRRSNQSILKKISPEYTLEGLMLKFQYFGYLMWRTDSHEKTLMLGKMEGGRRRGKQDEIIGWHHWLNGHGFEWAPGSWWWTGRPGVLQSMGSQSVRRDWATELNWWRPWRLDAFGAGGWSLCKKWWAVLF